MSKTIIKLLSLLIFNKKARGRFVELHSQKRNRIKGKGNQLIFIDHSGQEYKANLKRKLLGMRIIIEGDNNIIKICPDIPMKQNVLYIRGNDNLFELQPTKRRIDNLVIDYAYGRNRQVKIGKNYWTTGGFIIVCDNDTSITIGDNSMSSLGMQLRNTDNHVVFDDSGRLINKAQDVVIGNHVWIGVNVTILKNVHIADGCIVGAGSVVTKSFTEPNCAIGGNPAKVIKQGVFWSHETINEYTDKL